MSDEVIEFPDKSQTIIPPGHCACGCGGKTWNDSKFILGHNARVQKKVQENIIPHQFKPGEGGGWRGGRRRRAPITQAYTDLMNERYPGDAKGRTGAELLALAVFKAVVEEGSISAAHEITDRVEGPAGDPKNTAEINDPTETVRAQISEFIKRLRANPMASQGTPAGPGGDRPALPGGTDGIPGTPGEGVQPEVDG